MKPIDLAYFNVQGTPIVYNSFNRFQIGMFDEVAASGLWKLIFTPVYEGQKEVDPGPDWGAKVGIVWKLPTMKISKTSVITNLTRVTLEWETNLPARSVAIIYTQSGQTIEIQETSLYNKYNHQFAMSSILVPATSYKYFISSISVEGILATKEGTFTTKDYPTPTISHSVSPITDESATLKWSTDISATHQLVALKYGAVDALKASLQLTSSGSSASRELLDLRPNTTYTYTVQSSTPYKTSRASGSFTTKTPIAPVISNVSLTVASPTSVVVTWATDKETSTELYLAKTNEPSVQTNAYAAPLPVTTHRVELTGIFFSTQFNYRIRSVKRNGAASEMSGTFATPFAPWIVPTLLTP